MSLKCQTGITVAPDSEFMRMYMARFSCAITVTKKLDSELENDIRSAVYLDVVLGPDRSLHAKKLRDASSAIIMQCFDDLYGRMEWYKHHPQHHSEAYEHESNMGGENEIQNY